jgi:hypothetical protein
VRGQRHAPAAFYPGKDPVPIVQERLGGLQGRSEQVWKISPPLGFHPSHVVQYLMHFNDYILFSNVLAVSFVFYAFLMRGCLEEM